MGRSHSITGWGGCTASQAHMMQRCVIHASQSLQNVCIDSVEHTSCVTCHSMQCRKPQTIHWWRPVHQQPVQCTGLRIMYMLMQQHDACYRQLNSHKHLTSVYVVIPTGHRPSESVPAGLWSALGLSPAALLSPLALLPASVDSPGLPATASG